MCNQPTPSITQSAWDPLEDYFSCCWTGKLCFQCRTTTFEMKTKMDQNASYPWFRIYCHEHAAATISMASLNNHSNFFLGTKMDLKCKPGRCKGWSKVRMCSLNIFNIKETNKWHTTNRTWHNWKKSFLHDYYMDNQPALKLPKNRSFRYTVGECQFTNLYW